jgi:hypothetical protein
MSFAAIVKKSIEAIKAAHETSQGQGNDAYFIPKAYHPMADGKYLAALAAMHGGALISDGHLKKQVSEACERLDGSSLPAGQDGKTWGLGFALKNLPADEPYLITTAIVCNGLRQCLTSEVRIKALDQLLSAAQVGLHAMCRKNAMPPAHIAAISHPVAGKFFSSLLGRWRHRNTLIPLYSPGIREPVYNAAAAACACLALPVEGGRSNAEWKNVLRWIRLWKIANLGWPYAPGNPTVDLLHQCYILNALADVFGAPSVEEDTASMLGQFYGCGGLTDVLKLADGRSMSDNTDIIRIIDRKYSVRVLPRVARVWSLGELLVLLSRLAGHGRFTQFWLRQGRMIAQVLLSRLENTTDPETGYPRHTMHALHGLSCYLTLLRARTLEK